MKSFLAILLILCLFSISYSQEKSKEGENWTITGIPTTGQGVGGKIIFKKKSKLSFDLYDGLMLGSMIGDEISSHCSTCIEKNPIPTKTRIAIKASVFSLTKLLEYKYPNNPKSFIAFKLLITTLYIGVILHNLRVN